MTLASRRSIQENYAQLKSAQKSSRGAPVYSVLVNRPVGRFFAAVAHRWGLTPNQVTLVSALFTFIGIGALATLPPTAWTGMIVTGTLVVGYALDAADGQLARLRGGGTLTGEWLDHVIDSIKTATLHVAVLISMYRHFDVSDAWLLVPIVFMVADIIHFYGMLLTDLLTRNAALRAGRSPSARPNSPVVSVLKLPTDYGFQCFAFLLLAVPLAFQWVYLALTLANVVYTALVMVTWYRRLRKLDAFLAH